MPYLIFLPLVFASAWFGQAVQSEGRLSSDLAYVRAGGFVQANIDWSLAEERQGTINWPGKLDTDYDRLIITVKASPTWAREWPGYRCSRPAESAWPDYIRFVNAVIERYHPVAVAIWNEPEASPVSLGPDGWWFGCWGNDAEDYGRFLAQVYAGVKAAHPDTLIIGGELLADDLSWWRRAENVTTAAQYDVLSYHAYAYDGYAANAWRDRLAGLRAISPDAPIYLSETSLLAWQDCGEAFQARKAAYYRSVRDGYQQAGLMGFAWYTIAGNGWRCSDLWPGAAYQEYMQEASR